MGPNTQSLWVTRSQAVCGVEGMAQISSAWRAPPLISWLSCLEPQSSHLGEWAENAHGEDQEREPQVDRSESESRMTCLSLACPWGLANNSCHPTSSPMTLALDPEASVPSSVKPITHTCLPWGWLQEVSCACPPAALA